MIRRTIQEHLDKEKRLRPQGIKVLSPVLHRRGGAVPAVRRGRQPGEGRLRPHLRGRIPARWPSTPTTRPSSRKWTSTHAAEEVHDGYFSIDKKGGWTDTAENNQANRDNAERAYNLIMKDKEKLLSFETPLKFIFSHSALREGWDNPNVFQICALRDIRTERERRQTIGRGLRLCVNQDGERLRGFEVNTLTVIATESYEQFAENLQKEIEEDTGIRFGIVETHQFAGDRRDGRRTAQPTPLGFEQSKALWEHLKAQGYIDAKGKVQDALQHGAQGRHARAARRRSTPQLAQITEILRKLAGRLEIKNADERRQVRTRQAVLHSAEFKALWDRIKHKTTYRVQFDNEKLIADCIEALQRRAADRQDPAAMAQGRPRHRQGRRRGTETRRRRDRRARRGRHRAARPAHRPAGPDPAHPPQPSIAS